MKVGLQGSTYSGLHGFYSLQHQSRVLVFVCLFNKPAKI